MENNPVYKNYTIDQFTPQDLEQLSPVDIEEYQEYLKVYYNSEEKQITKYRKRACQKNVRSAQLLRILFQTSDHRKKSDTVRRHAQIT